MDRIKEHQIPDYLASMEAKAVHIWKAVVADGKCQRSPDYMLRLMQVKNDLAKLSEMEKKIRDQS